MQVAGAAFLSLASFLFTDAAAPEIYTLSLHDALPILAGEPESAAAQVDDARRHGRIGGIDLTRSEEHTSELQSRFDLVCRLLLEKKKMHIDRRGALPAQISPCDAHI